MRTPLASARHAPGKHSSRGMALLLVMIGLIVCSLLTAGFLGTQGTSIGIARNERDAERARAVAQSGIDLCYWQIRNRSDWRTAMTPGTWLSAQPVGDGTVTVTAASGDGTSSFANDTTQPVIFTSVGTVADRTYTLTGTIGPTGGGTVFRGGNFCSARIVLGTNDLNGLAVIDSYNSAVAPYNALFPGSNAVFSSNYAGSHALLVYFLSAYRGSFIGGAAENLSNAAYATLGAIAPVSTSLNSQTNIMGTVITPNTAGLTPMGIYSHASSVDMTAPGQYDSVTISGNGAMTTTITVRTSGIYYITGDLTIKSLGNLQIADGVNAVFIVGGNVTLTGSIKLLGAATLNLYVNGNTILNTGVGINSIVQNTSNFTYLGTGSGSITMNGTSQIYGAIYAPKSSVLLQNSTPKIYGAIVANDLTLANAAAFHFDQNLQSKSIDNLTGGSAPQGDADYNVSIVGSASLSSSSAH